MNSIFLSASNFLFLFLYRHNIANAAPPITLQHPEQDLGLDSSNRKTAAAAAGNEVIRWISFGRGELPNPVYLGGVGGFSGHFPLSRDRKLSMDLLSMLHNKSNYY